MTHLATCGPSTLFMHNMLTTRWNRAILLRFACITTHNHIKHLCNNNDSVALLKESSHQDHIEYGMTCINFYLGHSNSTKILSSSVALVVCEPVFIRITSVVPRLLTMYQKPAVRLDGATK